MKFIRVIKSKEKVSMFDAIRTYSIEQLQQLLDDGANIDDANGDGLTALHIASIIDTNKYPDILDKIKFLIDNGANIEKAEITGKTPLQLAVQYGNKKAAELLLKAGADPNCQDYDGIYPIFSAVSWDYTDIVKMLLEYGAYKNVKYKGKTPLLLALEDGKTDIITLLQD